MVDAVPLFKVRMPPSGVLIPLLQAVLYSGQIGDGDQVTAFEDNFAQWHGPGTTLVACSSGTAALHMALILAGVGPGDEVISTAMTAEPTNIAILQAGATVVWADVDPDNGTVTAETITPRITTRTKAVMVVDYAGMPVDMAPIATLAKRHGLKVIEDAAHALGAKYQDRSVGALADFTVYSFQAIKHMTTGDGGMVILSNPSLLDQARKLRWFGLSRNISRAQADISFVGYKYTMNNIAAAIGLAQLQTLENSLARHIANGQTFDAAFQDCPGVSPCQWSSDARPSYWLYTLLCDCRNDLERKLTERGISCGTVHKRNDLHSVFDSSRRPLPGLDHFSSRYLHLPCGWWVDDETRNRIITAVKEG